MHNDTPAPRVPDTVAEHNTDSHGQRTRSFNMEEFNDLVTTALDMQRLPDSSLAFSLKATANTRSPRRLQASTDTTQPSKVLRTFKDALKRKGAAENASERGSATRHPHLTRLSGTHHFASSSVPALPPTINHSGQIPYSPSLTNVDEYDSDGSETDPLSSAPDTPATSSPFGLYRAFPRDPWAQQEFSTSDTTEQPRMPQQRTRTKSTHKNFFMSLPFTKLKRKSSRLLFSSGSPPSPIVLGATSIDSPAGESDHSHSECDGMRSFFDDSGFEETDLVSFKPVRKAKSRPSIRHFFSAPSATFDSVLLQTNQDVQYRATKPLPPTPAHPTAELLREKEPLSSHSIPISSNAKFRIVQHEYASPFYAPPSLPHRPAPQPLETLPGKDLTGRVNMRHLNVHERSPFERLSRSMDLVRVPARIRSRYSPSPYPSPTSPLPPTPGTLPSKLKPEQPMNPLDSYGTDLESSEDMSCESADQSIDSIEISSWRTKGLKKRSSKTSSGSAHARGIPSRNSIRERFGLGPQLHIHVSSLETEQPKTVDHDDLQDPYIRTRTTSTRTIRPTSRVNTSMEVSTVRTLTSMSVSSLRESLNGYNQISYSDAGCHYEPFDLEEDPFAPDPLLTPPIIPTPPSPQSSAQSMKLRLITPLGNDSKPVSVSAPDTPNLWSSFLRLRQSSPSLATSTVTTSPGKTVYSSCTSFASPSSVNSGLPPSLVDALGARDSTPSPSGSPRRSNLSVSLNQLLLRTKVAQRNRKDSAISKSSYGNEGSISGGSSGITGHSDSRPHSPFPLLFFRSGTSKPSPITKEAYLGSASTEIAAGAASKHFEEEPDAHTPTSPAFPVRKLQPISVQDADAFGDACKRYSEFSMVSPLGFSTPVAPARELSGELPPKESDVVNGLCLTLNATKESHPSLMNDADSGANEGIHETNSYDANTTADNEDQRASKEVWPLPPLRTVVLDEVNGEGWHDVDQTIEHVPLYAAIPDVPRHTIRLPTTCRSGSHRSSSSKCSSSGSSNSRRLDAQQARKILETLNQTVDHPQSPSLLTNPLDRLSNQSHRRSLSLDSDFSFLSSDTGSQSIKTCASAYYSIQSSYSFRSKKSSSKSTALRRAMAPSNNNPLILTTSERPGSVQRAKSPTPSTFSQDRVASYNGSVNYGSTIFIKVVVANERLDANALPHRISLCDERMMTMTMTIAADSWTRLMGFCSQHESVCIEAGKKNAIIWISIEEVAITSDKADFYMTSIPGGLSSSSVHVLMTLSLNAPKHEKTTRDTSMNARNPDLTFCLPLPATLGEIAEHSRRSSVGEGFAGLTHVRLCSPSF